MSKGNFHAIFDQSTFEQFQTIIGKGNVTRAFENYMLNTISSNNKDLTNINIQLVIKKIEELNYKMSKIKSELDENLRLKEIYEQNRVKEEQIKLEKEKKLIEEQQKCIKCGNIIKTKVIKLKNGNMCIGCYQGLNLVDAKLYL